jgi:ribosomal protein L29
MKTAELRKLSVADLLVKLGDLKQENLNLRIARKLKSEMRHVSHSPIKLMIARINTILTEKGHH